MWKKIAEVSDDSTYYGLTSVYLQDTLVIEDSVIKEWYFTSVDGGVILRKNHVNILNKHILNTFASGVHPQAVCALIAYVDLSPSLEVHYTVKYLVPAQLEVLLLNLKSSCLTCIIQKVSKSGRASKQLGQPKPPSPPQQQHEEEGQLTSGNQVPEAREEGTPEAVKSDRSRTAQARRCSQRTEKPSEAKKPPPRPLSSLTKKLNEVETKKRRGNTNYAVSEQGYSLIRVLWTPESSCVETRRSKVGFDSYRYSPDTRCCTFFTAGDFQIVTTPSSLLYRINTMLTHLAIHISAQKQKKMVDRLVVYLQAWNLQDKDTQIAILFAEEIAIGGELIDTEIHEVWRQKTRRSFLPPLILNYDIVKKVYIAMTNPLIAQQMPDEYKDVYDKVASLNYAAKTGEQHVQLQRGDIAQQILVNINEDIGTSRQHKAYQFISSIACNFAGSIEQANESSVHIVETAINKPCVRCHAPRCAQRIPFKLLLYEPFVYIAQKYPVFRALYSESSVADMYRLLHYILTNDKEIFKYRDVLIITINSLLTKTPIDAQQAQKTRGQSSPCAHTSVAAHCTKELMANKGHLIDLFFSIYKTREDVLLPFDKLQSFFIMSSVSVASCVPVNLLRRCSIPEFNSTAFLKRLDDDHFVHKLYPVCQRCTNELLAAIKSLSE